MLNTPMFASRKGFAVSFLDVQSVFFTPKSDHTIEPGRQLYIATFKIIRVCSSSLTYILQAFELANFVLRLKNSQKLSFWALHKTLFDHMRTKCPTTR